IRALQTGRALSPCQGRTKSSSYRNLSNRLTDRATVRLCRICEVTVTPGGPSGRVRRSRLQRIKQLATAEPAVHLPGLTSLFPGQTGIPVRDPLSCQTHLAGNGL